MAPYYAMTTTAADSLARYPDKQQRPIVVWLSTVAALIFLMVVVGGITRLTRSGLSIVEWNPIMGAIPPLSEQSWLAEFAKYQQSPEYQHVNSGMTLTEFKEIFYVEWFHRLLGRLIGLVVFIPFIYFLIRGRIEKSLLPKIIIMLVLGGLQGALGWFMVKSGLVDIPRVSPYRLTAHLILAIGIYAYVLWQIFSLTHSSAPSANSRLRRLSVFVVALVMLMIVAGGFVAGTKAGFIFNTFPLMNGAMIPPGLYAMHPWWVNLFENVATVQFNHRLIAYVLVVVGIYFWWQVRSVASSQIVTAANAFLVALFVQVLLGISTLLLIVPVWLGALHQAGALVVLSCALFLAHSFRRT